MSFNFAPNNQHVSLMMKNVINFMDKNTPHLKKYEEIHLLAEKFFDEQKSRIQKVFPNIQVEHVGGTSIPGSLTFGDLDIQIRVTKEQFSQVRDVLKDFYHENKLELWTDELALFHWKDHPQISMSIVLTAIDSAYDEFYKTRDLLRARPDLLEKYNNLKQQYEGKSIEEYRIAKRAFFGPNGQNNLIE